MLSQIRSFLVVIQEGSLRSAANRLGITQPALSRQMQTLEHELGGLLLERTSKGVKPTNGGHALADNMAPVVAAYERAMVVARRQIKGETGQLRIGFLASAAREYLDPALKSARKAHPDLRFKLFDLTPGEQYRALRAGEIDLGLVDESARLFGREFYHRPLIKTKSLVALPTGHILANSKVIRLAQLKSEVFVDTHDDELPGLVRKMREYCRTVGKFRPRLIGPSRNISDSLDFVSNENAVILLPAFMHHLRHPGVVILPLADPEVTWELMIVWPPGEVSGVLKTLLDTLFPSRV